MAARDSVLCENCDNGCANAGARAAAQRDAMEMACGDAALAAGFERRLIDMRISAAREALVSAAGAPPFSTALHEGGHVVAAVHLACTVESVDIDTTRSCRFAYPDTISVDGRVAILFAGNLAEAYFGGQFLPAPIARIEAALARARGGHAGRCDDCLAIAAILDGEPNAADASVIARWRAVEARAMSFIHDPATLSSIKRVAVALDEKGRLGHDEVVSLVHADVLPRRAVTRPEEI